MVSEPAVVVMYFQDEGTGNKPGNAGGLQNLEKTKKQILPEGYRI